MNVFSRFVIFFLFLFCFSSFSLAGNWEGQATLEDGWVLNVYQFPHEGLTRKYGIAVPSDWTPGEWEGSTSGQSVLVFAHGQNSSPVAAANRFKFHETCISSGENCIVVYLAACEYPYVSGDTCVGGQGSRWQRDPDFPPGLDVDDPGYLTAAMRAVYNDSDYPVDASDVSILGSSNGASFVAYYQCRLQAFGGSFIKQSGIYKNYLRDTTCVGPPPIRKLTHIHGTDDTAVPFDWDSVDNEAVLNGCIPHANFLYQDTPSGGLPVDHYSYPNCTKPYGVDLIVGGGHHETPAQTKSFVFSVFLRFYGIDIDQ